MSDIQLEIDRVYASLDAKARDQFRQPERWMLKRSMEICAMTHLPIPIGEGERCSGEMRCTQCGREYREHPEDWSVIGYGDRPFLNLLCDGTRVKL